MADPFNLTDPSSADPSQGFGGIPADTWRNLMSLGAGMSVAANARNGQGFLTYGNGLAGPLGAGIQSTLGQSGEIAGLRSQLAQRQAQTQGQQIQNSGARVQNAMNLGRYNMAAPYLGQPTLDAQGNVAPQPTSQPAAAQSAADTPGGGDVFDRMPGPLQNVVASSAATYGIPPKLGAALLKQESDLGLRSSNVGQILPSTAADPGYGVPPLSAAGVNDPMQNIDFSMRYLAAKGAAAGVKDWTDPQQAAVGLAAYNGGGDPQYVQHVARYAPSIFGGGQPASASSGAPQDLISGIINGSVSINSLTPQQAGSLAGNPALNMLRPDIAKALTGYAMAGPTSGAEASAKMPYTINEVRPGGGLAIGGKIVSGMPAPTDEVLPSGAHISVLRNPLDNSIVGGAGPSTNIPQVGAVPGAGVLKSLSPAVTAARNEAAKGLVDKDEASYTGSQMTQAWLEQMDHAADQMNASGGWLSTGPSAELRLGMAAKTNDFFRSLGIAPPINPETIASWEEFKKANITAGFELSSHYEGHARQAAATIMNATAAVPSPANSPIGGKLVMAGIRESAQANIDAHQYEQEVFNNTGDLTSAPTDFFKANPGQMYARRAISTVTPYPVKGPNDFARYLPGTYVTTPSGKLAQVPARPGAPPIPDYLQGSQPGQQAQQ